MSIRIFFFNFIKMDDRPIAILFTICLQSSECAPNWSYVCDKKNSYYQTQSWSVNKHETKQLRILNSYEWHDASAAIYSIQYRSNYNFRIIRLFSKQNKTLFVCFWAGLGQCLYINTIYMNNDGSCLFDYTTYCIHSFVWLEQMGIVFYILLSVACNCCFSFQFSSSASQQIYKRHFYSTQNGDVSTQMKSPDNSQWNCGNSSFISPSFLFGKPSKIEKNAKRMYLQSAGWLKQQLNAAHVFQLMIIAGLVTLLRDIFVTFVTTDHEHQKQVHIRIMLKNLSCHLLLYWLLVLSFCAATSLNNLLPLTLFGTLNEFFFRSGQLEQRINLHTRADSYIQFNLLHQLHSLANNKR